jgi:transcriptional regulator with XRE-family HTH domain
LTPAPSGVIIINMNEAPSPISERLRRTIVESGIPLLKIEKDTGVQRASLSRFVNGRQSLRLDVADKLAAYFKLELRAKGKKGR